MIKDNISSANTVLINNQAFALTYAEIPEFLNASNDIGIAPDSFETTMQRICNRLTSLGDLNNPEVNKDLMFLKEIDFMLKGFLLKRI